MQKTYKKLFFSALFLIFATAAALALSMYSIDPCNIYSFKHKYQICNERYFNAGRIRHHLYDQDDFDTLIMGSSVSSNFLVKDIKEYLGWENPMRLFIYGYYIGETDTTLRFALDSGKIKKVLWGLDIDRYEATPELALWRDATTFPPYLYNHSIWDDFKYLTSRMSVGKAIEFARKGRVERKDFPITGDNDYHKFWAIDPINTWDAYQFSHDFFELPKPALDSWVPADKEYALAKQYIVDVVKDYPDVEFYLFFPPYPYSYLKLNYLNLRGYLVKHFAGLKNVHLFDFANQSEWGRNSAYFRDVGHYHANLNVAMLKAIGEGKNELTTENINSHHADLIKIFDGLQYITDFEATMISPPVFKMKSYQRFFDEKSVKILTGKQKFEPAKTYVLTVGAEVPNDGTLTVSWESFMKRQTPQIRVPLKKGENELHFILMFYPLEQEIMLDFNAGMGDYLIKKVEIALQKEDL